MDNRSKKKKKAKKKTDNMYLCISVKNADNINSVPQLGQRHTTKRGGGGGGGGGSPHTCKPHLFFFS